MKETIINSGISKSKLKEPLSPMQHLNKCSMFKSPYLNCSSILLSPLSMQRLTNWRTLSRLSKQVLNTHTHKKKDEGDLSSSKSQLQGAEKDMDEIKTAMGLQENKKIEYLGRTKPQQSVWNTRVGGRDVRSGWIESQRSRICLILKFNRASTPSFIAYKEWTDGIQHQVHPKLTVTVCRLCDWKQKEAVL